MQHPCLKLVQRFAKTEIGLQLTHPGFFSDYTVAQRADEGKIIIESDSLDNTHRE